MRAAFLVSALIVSSMGLSSCGGSTNASNPPPPQAQPLVITSSALPNGDAQASYNFTLTASGGLAPYTWGWTPATGSSVPGGLNISTAGLISGVPSAAGTYQVTVTVADSESPVVKVSASFSIVIGPAGGLEITSGPPPNGTVGEPYGESHTVNGEGGSITFSGWELAAAGGSGKLHWSWSAAQRSATPPGLSIQILSKTSGGSTRCCVMVVTPPFIGGTPTMAGTFRVIVTVTDSASPPAQASAGYTIGISDAGGANPEAASRASNEQRRYRLIDLGTFGGPQSYVNQPDNYAPVLNGRGEVAGWADTAAADPFPDFCFDVDCFVAHAFATSNGVAVDLGVLNGGSSSQANWISANGLIAGISQNGEIDRLFVGFPEFRAVLWQDGKIRDLGTLPGGGYESFANAVNSSGQVVGLATNTVLDDFSLFGTTQARAFVWENGEMRDLGTLGGSDSIANLINERGQIVGESYLSATPSAYCSQLGYPLATGAFIWERGGMKNLGSFGGTCTFASDINDRGEVVGISTLPGDEIQHAFIWRNGSLQELRNTLGGDNASAIQINEAGDATGFAALAGDQILRRSAVEERRAYGFGNRQWGWVQFWVLCERQG